MGDQSMNPAFVEARAKLHAARQEEARKSRELVKQFIKQRQGDITSDEIGTLMRESGMPYNTDAYAPLRMEAGVPLEKVQVRLTEHGRKERMKALRIEWRAMIDGLPDEERPRVVHGLNPKGDSVRKKKRAPEVEEQEAPANSSATLDLRDVKTKDLVAELERRKVEAISVLRIMGGLPEKWLQLTDFGEKK